MPAQLTKDTVEQKNQEIDDLTEMMMRCLENADVEDFIGKIVRIKLYRVVLLVYCLISSIIHIMKIYVNLFTLPLSISIIFYYDLRSSAHRLANILRIYIRSTICPLFCFIGSRYDGN